MNYDTAQFLKDASELGVELEQDQVKQFLIYYEMLTEWNQMMNLTAITEYNAVMKKHFIDSISLCKAVDLSREISCIDVGTGAGFPGLALKIAYPKLRMTLLDSLNKRILFLNELIERLCLSGVETIHGRAEDFAKKDQLREKFDLSVSRAVANLSTLSEYCLPFVKKEGYFVAYKSEKIAEETEAAKKAVFILGGEIKEQVSFTLPDSDIERNLVVIKKRRETPGKYPRRAGLPVKEPLM